MKDGELMIVTSLIVIVCGIFNYYVLLIYVWALKKSKEGLRQTLQESRQPQRQRKGIQDCSTQIRCMRERNGGRTDINEKQNEVAERGSRQSWTQRKEKTPSSRHI
jgi:hypothetical protein